MKGFGNINHWLGHHLCPALSCFSHPRRPEVKWMQFAHRKQACEGWLYYSSQMQLCLHNCDVPGAMKTPHGRNCPHPKRTSVLWKNVTGHIHGGWSHQHLPDKASSLPGKRCTNKSCRPTASSQDHLRRSWHLNAQKSLQTPRTSCPASTDHS